MIPARRDILLFISIAYVISWVTWYSLYMWTNLSVGVVVLTGAFGPSISGLYMAFRINRWAGMKEMLKRGFEFRMDASYYLLALGLMPFLFLLAYWLSDEKGALLLNKPWLLVPYFIYMLIIGGTIQEEYGWRGYLLDALQLNLSPIKSSLIVGAIWTIWHFPLFFIEGTGQSLLPFWLFAIAILSFTVIISWLYNATTMNLWSTFMIHTMFNVSFALVPLVKPEEFPIGLIYLALLLFITALLLVWRTRGSLGYDHFEQLEAVEGTHQQKVTEVKQRGKEKN